MTEQQKENILLSIDNKVSNHDELLKTIDNKVSNYDELLKTINNKVSNHDELLKTIDNKVSNYDELLKTIDNKVSNHDEILKTIVEKLDNHSEKLSNHDEQFKMIVEKLSNHDEQFKVAFEKIELRDNLLIAIAKEVASLRIDMNNRFEKVEKELERQRQNMVRIEYELSNKIEALFDISKIKEDKFQEQDTKIIDIKDTLDWHDSRIFKLETSSK